MCDQVFGHLYARGSVGIDMKYWFTMLLTYVQVVELPGELQILNTWREVLVETTSIVEHMYSTGEKKWWEYRCIDYTQGILLQCSSRGPVSFDNI